jgi:hypothetical protein
METVQLENSFLIVHLKSIFPKPIYEIFSENGECLCKKCNPSLNKAYSEKNSILRREKISCIKNT